MIEKVGLSLICSILQKPILYLEFSLSISVDIHPGTSLSLLNLTPLGTENSSHADEALNVLRLAKKTEAGMPSIYKYQGQAYALKKDLPRAELSTAKFAWLTGDKKLAIEKATIAQNYFKHGTPEWLEANDILTFANRK